MQEKDFFSNQEFLESSGENNECGQPLVEIARRLAQIYKSAEEHHGLTQPWWAEFRSAFTDYEDTI